MDKALAPTIGALVDAEVTGETPSTPVAAASRFELGELLGEGGMGRVLRAEDQQFGRVVALKELPDERATVSAHKRFLREALITGNLEHPGVPAVYERGVRDGRQYYAMRLVEGRTLSDAIDSAHNLEERLALVPAVADLAHTLGFAHAHGVVHRDVKPDNVVLGDHGETVLLDWGIARMRDEGSLASGDHLPADPLETSDGTVLGTPAYMAPEQASGDLDRISAATDVFALGAVLYHVLSGRPPYSEGSVHEVIARASRADHPPIDEAAPRVPKPLRAIVARALSREPNRRYHTADAMAEDLTRVTARSLGQLGSGFSKYLATTVSVLASLLVLAVLGATGMTVSVREIGFGFYILLTSGGLGLLASAIELYTRGRNRLTALSLAMLGGTLLYTVGTFAQGVVLVTQAAARTEAPDLVPLLLEGMHEISQILVLGSAVAALQLLVWALVRRRLDVVG